MSLTLDLQPEVESRVREAAAEEGVSVEEIIARAFPPRSAKTTKTAKRDPRAHVHALLTAWQEYDQTPMIPPTTSANTPTPSEALFRKWEQEDDALTESEQQAQAEVWEQFQQGINAERAATGMRLVF